MRFVLALALLLLAAFPGAADAKTAAPTAEEQRLIDLRDSLKPVRGVVRLPEAQVTLNLGEKYDFLAAKDAKRVLIEGWGNPPETVEDVLGLVFPAGKSFLDEAWGAVLTYEDIGHVDDSDAETADYDELITAMRADAEARNPEREKQGFVATHIIGWAQPPTYDRAHNGLIWAREVQFGDETDHTLNYEVRRLGRHGVLSMNMVSTMSQIAEVRAAATGLSLAADFDPGRRYADHAVGDKQAGIGLAGLVAAGLGVGVAQKAGLIGVLILALKKGSVLIIGLAAAAWAWMRKRFRSKEL